MMVKNSVLIADDHVIIRRGLRFLLNSYFADTLIYETDSLKGLIDTLKNQTFSHLILDMQMQDGNLLEIFSQVKSQNPAVRILIYTMSPEDIFGKRMLQLGADGFLSKQTSEQEVIDALTLFFKGKKYISHHLQEHLNNEQIDNKDNANPLETLSDRELSVLNYLLKGESVKDIAIQLAVKPNTVATFKARLFDKLGVSNLIDLKNIAELYNYLPS